MRITLIFVAVFAMGLAAVAAWHAAIGWRPSSDQYPVQGVDVSEADGALDWKAVAAGGADFGYAVATVGSTRRDAAFEANWQDMDAAGLRRGAIHVYSLCQLASDQANAFNTVVPNDAAALPAAVAIDYAADCTSRPDAKVLAQEIARFATMVESHLCKPILLQVSRRVESDYHLSAALPRSLWALGNVFPPDYAARPWRMWRASDFRRIDGIATPLNWDVAAP